MSKLVIVVKMEVKEKYMGDFMTHMIQNARESLEERGCKTFDIAVLLYFWQ